MILTMYYIWTLFSKYINRGLLNVLGKIWNISITNHTVTQATILFKKTFHNLCGYFHKAN